MMGGQVVLEEQTILAQKVHLEQEEMDQQILVMNQVVAAAAAGMVAAVAVVEIMKVQLVVVVDQDMF